jgi:hypothetical protein
MSVPIDVTTFVTWSSSIPTNAVEFIVRPEKPALVSATELNVRVESITYH